MTAVQILCEWLATMIETMLYFCIVHAAAQPRYQRKKQVGLTLLVCLAIVTGVLLLNMVSITLSLPTIVYAVFSLSCGGAILFKGKFREFVFISICFTTGLNILEGTILFVLKNIGFQDAVYKMLHGFSDTRICIIAGMKATEILVTVGVCRLLKTVKLRLKVSYKALLSSTFLFFIVLYWANQMVFPLGLKSYQAILGVCCAFIVCSGYFYMRMRDIRKEKDDTVLQNQILEKNYRTAEEAYETNAQLYHDMRNHFSLLQGYLAEGKVTEAQDYLRKISNASAAYVQTRWTGIDTVDYILGQKIAAAQKEGIQTEIHAEYPKDCSIDPVDLCTILTNLMDNAIESCMKQPQGAKRELKVTIRRINQFIIIKITNTSSHEPVIKDGMLVTSKKDSKYHGWGMKSVKAAAEKYHGTMKYEYQNSCFSVGVMLFYQ